MTAKKKSGIITTFVPHKYSWWTLVRPFFMPGIKETPFTLSALKKLHSNSNMTLEKYGGLNVLPIGLSPDRLIGRQLGMILYAFCR